MSREKDRRQLKSGQAFPPQNPLAVLPAPAKKIALPPAFRPNPLVGATPISAEENGGEKEVETID
jgi:hypothetical protein